MDIVLGHRYKDVVSGVDGIAISRSQHLNGCVSIVLDIGKDKDGKAHTYHAQYETLLQPTSGATAPTSIVVPTHSNLVLGRKYKDSVTGFEGIAEVRADNLAGYVHVTLCPGVDKKNRMQRSYSFDEERLVDAETGAPVATSVQGVGPSLHCFE